MSVEHFILESGKSSELIAALRLITEAEDNGQTRFPPDACGSVAKTIVCRTYASALLELCHLSRAASAFRGGNLDFFWGPGPMRASRFRGVFAPLSGKSANLFTIADNGIDLVYRDKPFSVAYSRMPFLAALIEFLVTAIGFSRVDDLLSPLARPGLTAAEVSAQANALSRALYDWLKDHLPSVQAQRKLGVLVEFLKGRNGGDFDRDTIDDNAILDFWRQAATVPDLEDFRTFRSAFLAFARLRQVIDNADSLRALDHAAPIGSEREHGEVDPDEVEAFVDVVSEDSNPLDELATLPASRIKFLNAKERELCHFLFACGRLVDPLPLSFVRCEVFGPAQSRVTQGLRDGKGKMLTALISGCFATDYRGYQAALSELAEHGRTVLLACAHILHNAGIVTVPEDAKVISLRGKTALDPSIGNAEAGSFLQEAQRAAKGISRQGFRPADLADEEIREGYIVGVPLVAKVTDRISTFLDLLARQALPSKDWDMQFGQDKSVFAACFQAIYGDAT